MPQAASALAPPDERFSTSIRDTPPLDSSSIRDTPPPQFFEHSGYPKACSKEQVARRTSSRSDEPVDNSLKTEQVVQNK